MPSLAVWRTRYWQYIRTAWLVDLQYGAAIAIWMLWGVMEPVVSLGIWWSIAGSGSVAGYARADFARYFFAVILVNQLAMSWDAWYIDRWIRQGELNHRLARPISPLHEAIADNLAYKARSASVLVVIWLVVAAIWPAVRMPLDPRRWALAALATLLAAVIRFFNNYATGLLAFWTTRATALVELQFGLSLFLSGRVAPLSLLPRAVASVANVLWFPYMLAFPVGLLTGAVPEAAILPGFAMQVGWAAAWVGLYSLVWSRGLRHYGAVGG
ncbi:MAG TPA: ABC-2 family transporter protein [Longimicrobiales bacterium]